MESRPTHMIAALVLASESQGFAELHGTRSTSTRRRTRGSFGFDAVSRPHATLLSTSGRADVVSDGSQSGEFCRGTRGGTHRRHPPRPSRFAAGVQLLERTIPRRRFVDPWAREIGGNVKVRNGDFGDLGQAWVVREVHKAWRFDERLPR